MSTMQTPNPLISALMERQCREGWSNGRMAGEIGTSRENWRFLKAGRHQPGMRTIKAIVARFPEYSHLALFFLLPSVTVDNTNVAVVDKESARVA